VRNPCQHISSALFGVLLLLPILAIGFLQIGRTYIQSQREERLEKKELVEVVVPAKDLVWEEEGKELWVGKQMFDVASYSVTNGYYHLLGVYDEDETEVAGSLLHILFSKDNAAFLRLLLLLQCFCIAVFSYKSLVSIIYLKKLFSCFSSPLFSRTYLVLGPPPRQ
jgi:hypothetical protein